jgi:glucose 1-dehydrogenase
LSSNSINLKKRVAIIVGAAQGICKSMAKYMATLGYTIVVTDQQKEKGTKVSKEIQRNGGEAIFHEVNLLDKQSISALVENVGIQLGQIDCIVNGARSHLKENSFPASMSEWDNAMQVMLKAPAILISEALPWLRKSNNASVVNISSTNAYLISQQPISYHVAKAGLVQLTKSLAVELGSEKIRVNAVCPGLVEKPDRQKPTLSDPLHNQIIESVVPLQEPCTADQIGATVAFLCSDEAQSITGQSLIVDGGMTLIDQHFACSRFEKFNREP